MTTNPFSAFGDLNMGNFDLSKFGFGNFGLGNFDMSKMFTGFKLPGADLDGLMGAQHKNMEALAEANKAAVSGMQAIVKRQGEILGETMSAATVAVQQLTTITDPRERTTKQLELTKVAFEKALSNMKELADTVAKSAEQALGAINKRVAESLDEVKSMTAKK